MPKDTQGTLTHRGTIHGTTVPRSIYCEWEGAYGRPDGYGNNLRTETTKTHPTVLRRSCTRIFTVTKYAG
jgi:hypothetical protein